MDYRIWNNEWRRIWKEIIDDNETLKDQWWQEKSENWTVNNEEEQMNSDK